MAFGSNIFKRTSIPLLLVLFAVALVFIHVSRQTKEKESFADNSAGGYVFFGFVIIISLMGALAIPYMISKLDN
jgi:hypothetical protein